MRVVLYKINKNRHFLHVYPRFCAFILKKYNNLKTDEKRFDIIFPEVKIWMN